MLCSRSTTFNAQYIKTASSVVGLLYRRSELKPSQPIGSPYQIDQRLVDALEKTDKLYIYLYLKPLGDSILFLSTVRAVLDYLELKRHANMPMLYAQTDMSKLLRHCELFKKALYIDNVEESFAKESQSSVVVMVTDGDPFEFNSPSAVFNTENYVYPKFVDRSAKSPIYYPSRPSRYYLTFEREVGTVLSSNPNRSMPTFELQHNSILETVLHKLAPDFCAYDLHISLIALVSPKERQKQFGLLKYLKLARHVQAKLPSKKILFVLLAHQSEEEKDVWEEALIYINMHTEVHVAVYDNNNLEELAYILARMDLHVGNDTGMSHLASVCRREKKATLTPTIMLYSRHDFGKWSTGHSNIYPISTKLAQYLTRTNQSIGRDKIDLKPWGRTEFAASIPISRICRKILVILGGNVRCPKRK